MSETLVMNQPFVEAEQRNNWIYKAMAVGTAVVLAAGCSSESAGSHTNKAANNETTKTLENTCGNIDFSKNYADTHYGAPTAIFGNLYHDNNGKKELFSSDDVSKSLKATVAQDYRALAHVKAFVFDTRSAVTPADLAASNIERDAQNLIAKYEANPETIKADVAEVCNGLAPTLIEENDKFRVARNLTSEAVFERDGGKVTKTGIMPSSTPGTLRGFKINPNFDDGSNADRRDSLQELADSILITADGKLVIKFTTGPLMFEISKKSTTTPVDIKIGAHEQITVKPNNKVQSGGNTSNNANNNSTSNSSNNNSSTATNGGKTGGTNGHTGSKGTTTGTSPEKNNGPAGGNTSGSGNSPEAAPNGNDNTPGGSGGSPSQGPSGPSGGETPAPAPHESPAPAPQQTQPAPHETQPAPQQTQPAPQQSTQPPQPQPSPTGNKGAEPSPACTPSEYKPC